MAEDSRLCVGINTDYEAGVDWETRVRLCAEAGFAHVHWCEDYANRNLYDDAFIERIRVFFEGLGISLLGMHNPSTADQDIYSDDPAVRARGIELFKNRALATKRLGSDCLVFHPVPLEPPERVRAFESLDRITDFCGEHGVRLALEASTEAAGDACFERYPPQVMGFCLDTGHCHNRVPPTLHLLEKYADRLCATHLQDTYGREDDHRLPFDGTLPWPRVAEAFRKMGYARPLCVEVARRTYMDGKYSEAEKQITREQFVTAAYERAVEIATCSGRAAI